LEDDGLNRRPHHLSRHFVSPAFRIGRGLFNASIHRAPRGRNATRERQMKRFILLTVLLASVAGAFAAMAPASADPHGDRMKRDCNSGARKC
jgi:hypothetical protein